MMREDVALPYVLNSGVLFDMAKQRGSEFFNLPKLAMRILCNSNKSGTALDSTEYTGCIIGEARKEFRALNYVDASEDLEAAN